MDYLVAAIVVAFLALAHKVRGLSRGRVRLRVVKGGKK